jgi:hypothetical protein
MSSLQQNLSTVFAPASGALVLVERAEDNISESRRLWEADQQKLCGGTAQQRTDDEQETFLTNLCVMYAEEWRHRKIRQYPDTLARWRATTGTVANLGVKEETAEEYLTFNGSRSAELSVPATSVAFLEGTFYLDDGTQVYPSKSFDGISTVTLSREVHGVLKVRRTSRYRLLKLTVDPIGAEINSLMFAFADGASATLSVNYIPEYCPYDPTKQPAGDDCGLVNGSDVGSDDVDDPIDYAGLGTPRITAVNHASSVIEGETLTVRVTIRNYSSTSSASGTLYIGPRPWAEQPRNATSYNLAAGETQTFSLGYIHPRVEFFNMQANLDEVVNLTVFGGLVEVIAADADAEGNQLGTVYNEVSRDMDEVVVGGVTIKRITRVTFEAADGSGRRYTEIFNNAGVDP